MGKGGPVIPWKAIESTRPPRWLGVRLVEARGAQLPDVILPAARSGTADAGLPAAVERP
ncbi:hypothetical protein M8J71_09535 [Pseudarthrobacter sp. R1]|uniref:hypothetical protein n=1 Tax=Pseudarthrobacter sp. R1 TaxID=2944934 RepID=UPI002109D389|nr:hypothetical protein [Pseudarthrobacter sp. R1]MCQ6270720.1 hypothetical protein [Pseudarthrobacter sp. R1]